MHRLSFTFFARDTHVVARGLLGKLLVRHYCGKQLSGRITEVESYVGENDAACHASRGKTQRTEVMFGPPGRAYVYLIYGMYHCLNVVTEHEHFPAAVLIRSLEPIAGISTMHRLRGTDDVHNLTTGPGKLTRAFALTRELNDENFVTSERLYIADDGYRVSRRAIVRSPRVGVAYAGADALLPWRYLLRDSAFVSQRRS